jgi:hypothetical protein
MIVKNFPVFIGAAEAIKEMISILGSHKTKENPTAYLITHLVRKRRNRLFIFQSGKLCLIPLAKSPLARRKTTKTGKLWHKTNIFIPFRFIVNEL